MPYQFNDEQKRNAAIIIRVGKAVGASDRDILIALMTASQESNLKNLNYGDRDSLGLFQQRPSMGWGSREEVTNPVYAAKTFFKGKPGNPGLFSLRNRDSMALTAAAQAVQRSAYPSAYAKWEDEARGLMAELGSAGSGGGIPLPRGAMGRFPMMMPNQSMNWWAPQGRQGPDMTPAPGFFPGIGRVDRTPALSTQPIGQVTAGGPNINPMGLQWWQIPNLDQMTFARLQQSQLQQQMLMRRGYTSGQGNAIVDYAKNFLGVPYVWGGTTSRGVDCSGLVYLVYKNFGIELPRLSADQARAGTQISAAEAQPGDLWAVDNSTRNNGADHIAIYVGNGYILEAPRPGLNVRIRKLTAEDGGWFVRVSGGRQVAPSNVFSGMAAPVRRAAAPVTRAPAPAPRQVTHRRGYSTTRSTPARSVPSSTYTSARGSYTPTGQSERTVVSNKKLNPNAFRSLITWR